MTGHTYFSRFFPTPDGVLVSHHSIARDGPVYFALLKATHVDAQGTLRLVWWNGNEPLKHEPVEVETPAPTGEAAPAIAMLEPSFDVDRGVVMEGIVALPAAETFALGVLPRRRAPRMLQPPRPSRRAESA